jgi:hypothetical protein
MSTPAGALAPHTIPGEIVTPDAVLDPKSIPAHDFFNVMRDIVHRTTYHHESEKNAALDAVDAFESRFVPVQDRKYVQLETDYAGREDVSQRTPPQVGTLPVPAGPAIDYNRLAAAIVAMQQQANAENAKDVPPTQGGYGE